MRTRVADEIIKDTLLNNYPKSKNINISRLKVKGSKCNGSYKRDISEIKLEFDILGNNEYEILSEEYVNAGNKLLVKHKTCGNEYYVSRRNFRKGRRCPICSSSKGEFKVSDFLERNKIEFEKEKKYDDLVGIGGGKLRFDFYLPKQNILIEYDGELHYKETSLGNDLKCQKYHDELKNTYCEKNNIKLIRIPYWEFDNIETILSNEFLN